MNLSLLTNKQMEMRTNKFMIYVFSAIMLGGMVACSSDDPETDTGNGNGNGGNAEAPYVWGTEGGASCHSSINFGCSPFNNKDGLVAAVARYSSALSGSCNLITLLACCSAVVVFPVHFGPSISTAPNVSKRS